MGDELVTELMTFSLQVPIVDQSCWDGQVGDLLLMLVMILCIVSG